jgi:hypothetical protein
MDMAQSPEPALTTTQAAYSDGFKRPNKLASHLGGDLVVLLAPPGEAALVIPHAARELALHQVQHADVIEHRQPAGRVLPCARR